MKDDYFLKKLESSHQAIAETVSAYGAEVKKNNDEIIDLKRIVKDFIVRADKMLDKHEKEIDELQKSDTDIRSTFKGGKWGVTASITVVFILIGTISTLTYNIYSRDFLAVNTKYDVLEKRYNQDFNRIITLLEDDKVRTKIIQAQTK